MDRHEISIIGGGLIGPALALALEGAGFDVAVIDAEPSARRKDPAFDGRAYAIALASQRLLTAIGVWDEVAAKAEPIADIQVGEGAAAAPLLHFDPRELDEGRFGWILEDRFLRTALLERMGARGIAHYAPAKVQEVLRQPTGAEISLADGRSLAANLVVAADGRRSTIARGAGIQRLGWSYAQTGLVNAISHELPHNGLAFQSFFPGGPFAVLPLPGNRCSLVWSERRETARHLAELSDAAFTAELARRIGGRLGEVALEGRRWAYPLDLSLATSFTAPRLALIGDAAHGVHPIAGQGMNLGLRDVAALAEVLVEAAGRGEDIGALDVLARYQTWRRFDNVVMALGMDALNGLFSNDNPVLGGLRRAGLGAVNRLGGLRRGFMRQAVGVAGEMPRLLQGKPL